MYNLGVFGNLFTFLTELVSLCSHIFLMIFLVWVDTHARSDKIRILGHGMYQTNDI